MSVGLPDPHSELEGKCTVDSAWYDVDILEFRQEECLVKYVGFDEQEWISISNLRPRSQSFRYGDARIQVGTNVVACQKRKSYDLYFDARIVSLEGGPNRCLQVEYQEGPEVGSTEWLNCGYIFLSFPSETLTTARAQELFPSHFQLSPCPNRRLKPRSSSRPAARPSGNDGSDASTVLLSWLQTAPLPERVREVLQAQRGPLNLNARVVERIVHHRWAAEPPVAAGCSAPRGVEYRVKWSGHCYRKCQYVPREVLALIARSKLAAYHRRLPALAAGQDGDPTAPETGPSGDSGGDSGEGEDWQEGVRADWITVDRVVDEAAQGAALLVKWRGLGYAQATWEAPGFLLGEEEPAALEALRSRRDRYRRRGALPNATDGGRAACLPLREQPRCLRGGTLYPYQLEGLSWLLSKRSEHMGVILADEMGLGKTVQVAGMIGVLLDELPLELRPFLLVVPLSTVRNWRREFEAWCPHVNFVEYVGSQEDRKLVRKTEFDPEGLGVQKFEVLCTNYEVAMQDSSALLAVEWEGLIVDEGQRLKGGIETSLFEVLTRITARHRILVTGTPLQNGLAELFNLLHFLDCKGQRFPTMDTFKDMHKGSTPEQKVEALKSILQPYMLRRLKKDLNINLVEKLEKVIPVGLTRVQRDYYAAILTKNFRILNGSDEIRGRTSLLNVLMELRKCCNHAYLFQSAVPGDPAAASDLSLLVSASGKLQFLDQILPLLKERGHRVLLFSQFTTMLDIIEVYLRGRGHLFARIDGQVSLEARQSAIDAFNSACSPLFIFLLSTRAGGVGINLATADTVLIFDSDFNPHNDIQALSRAHRIGQMRKLLVLRLVCRSTVEEAILRVARRKLALESVVVDGCIGRKSSRALTSEEIEAILAHGAQEIISSAAPKVHSIKSSAGTAGNLPEKNEGVLQPQATAGKGQLSDIPGVRAECFRKQHNIRSSSKSCIENVDMSSSSAFDFGCDLIAEILDRSSNKSFAELEDVKDFLGSFNYHSDPSVRGFDFECSGKVFSRRNAEAFWDKVLSERALLLDCDQSMPILGRGMRERHQVLYKEMAGSVCSEDEDFILSKSNRRRRSLLEGGALHANPCLASVTACDDKKKDKDKILMNATRPKKMSRKAADGTNQDGDNHDGGLYRLLSDSCSTNIEKDLIPFFISFFGFNWKNESHAESLKYVLRDIIRSRDCEGLGRQYDKLIPDFPDFEQHCIVYYLGKMAVVFKQHVDQMRLIVSELLMKPAYTVEKSLVLSLFGKNEIGDTIISPRNATLLALDFNPAIHCIFETRDHVQKGVRTLLDVEGPQPSREFLEFLGNVCFWCPQVGYNIDTRPMYRLDPDRLFINHAFCYIVHRLSELKYMNIYVPGHVLSEVDIFDNRYNGIIARKTSGEPVVLMPSCPLFSKQLVAYIQTLIWCAPWADAGDSDREAQFYSDCFARLDRFSDDDFANLLKCVFTDWWKAIQQRNQSNNVNGIISQRHKIPDTQGSFLA